MDEVVDEVVEEEVVEVVDVVVAFDVVVEEDVVVVGSLVVELVVCSSGPPLQPQKRNIISDNTISSLFIMCTVPSYNLIYGMASINT